MFIHNVCFWLKKDLSTADRATFESEVKLLTQIPYLERGYAGIPADTERRAVTDHSFDYATSLHFKSLADHDYYQKECPAHARFVAACKTFWDRVSIHDVCPI
ncbi:MAG: Dabb family protein [Planctomycetota bacterium]